MNIGRARDHAETIFRHVMQEADPQRLTRESISLADDAIEVRGVRHVIPRVGRVVLFGVGKSAVGMARGVEAAIGERLDHGLVVTKRGLAGEQQLLRTEILEASHPVPDESSVTAGRRLLDEARRLTADDLAICAISGGGSALVEAPVDGVTLDDFKLATSVLLRGGADIWTLNAVRRRLSLIKAGGLARAAAPARIVNLVLSDVLGSPLGVIASGLSVNAVEDDQWRIDQLKSGPVWAELPELVRDRLSTPLPQAEREGSNVVQSVVVGDAETAAAAAARAAVKLGYRSYVLGARFAGDAREFGRFWAQLARSARLGSTDFELPCCLVAAGEMTVNVRGDGRGGRNTEMAASAALELDGARGIAVASLATDGDDGSSGAAGGVVVGTSVARLRRIGHDPLDLLARNDTREFLEAAGGLIVTGQTGTNVNDVYLAFIGELSPRETTD